MTAWAYLVVSDDSQADSLTDQERWAKETAATHGWHLSRTFQGVSSGKKGTRKLLTDLLNELRTTPKTQRPQRILMIRLDRTGRGIGIDSLAAIAEIRHLGVMLHTREDGDVKIERAADTLVPFMRVLTGALENEARSDKWKAVHARRRAAGLHLGSVPYGCILIDGKAAPYEPEAAVVRAVYEHAAQGWGYAKIARWAAEHAPAKRNADGSSTPVRWSPSTVRSILKGTTVRALLIERSLAQAVDRMRGLAFKERSTARHAWPLRGAVRCTCGKMLSGHMAGNKPHLFRYYFCRWHSIEKGQTHPAHRAEDLERSFVELLRRIVADPDLMISRPRTNLTELQAREATLRKELDEQDRRRQKVWTLAEGGSLSGEQLRERLDEIDADRTALRSQLSDLRAQIEQSKAAEPAVRSVLAVLGDLAALWPTADVALQQGVAKGIAATPTVGGLWAHPKHRGKLYAGFDVAKKHLADARRMIVPCEQSPERFLGNIKGLLAAAEMKKAPAGR